MQFSLIISNPPYNQNLDLKILKEIYNLSEKICFVHPAGWLYYQKPSHPLYFPIREMIKNDLEYVEMHKTYELFGTWTFMPTAITLFNKQCVDALNPNSFDLHGDSDLYKSLKEKTLSYCKKSNILLYVDYKKNKKQTKDKKEFQVGLPEFAPSGRTVMIQKTDELMQCASNTKYASKFFFNTESEALNFKDYLKTKIARFCLSIYKINQQLDRGELASVPYMPTYTHPWTDEDVAKELGLTEEELAWAINWIPDYYPEDAEKYAKWKKNDFLNEYINYNNKIINHNEKQKQNQSNKVFKRINFKQ